MPDKLENIIQDNSEADELAKLAVAIRKAGPRNCSLISRMTGIPVETVRYKIRRQLIRKGVIMRVHADYNKLGLVRTWVNLKFTKEFLSAADRFLDKLSKVSYLVYRGKIIPTGSHIAVFAVPYVGREKFTAFLDELVRLGVLRSYEKKELSVVNYPHMQAEHYDFDKRTWFVDWLKLRPTSDVADEQISDFSSKPHCDNIDLLILKELQLNATQPLTKIGRKLGIDPKIVRYHYQEHLMRRGLILRYVLSWFDTQEDRWRKVLYSFMELRDLNSKELRRAREVFASIPFTWFDSVSPDGKFYFVQLIVPLIEFQDLCRYVYNYLPEMVTNSYQTFVTEAMAYTLPYEQFTDEQGWDLNMEKALEIVKTAMDEVRNGGSRTPDKL